MGAGKTTVVGPLLTLLLADGASLVTQVSHVTATSLPRHSHADEASLVTQVSHVTATSLPRHSHADEASLVTQQVMPTALLEQTRDIMRSRFSNPVLSKSVFTLEFERSCEDSVEVVAELLSKLDHARRSRSVVCAAPEAVKSLYLKVSQSIATSCHVTDTLRSCPSTSS